MTLLSWQCAGDAGHAVVLVHAWAQNGPTQWEETGWVTALQRAGFAVYVPDLPGHAASADVPVPEDAEPGSWAAQVIVADLDRLGVGAMGVVGFADGCLVAGHLAVRIPERVRKLVLIGCDDRRPLPQGEEIATALRDPDARLWNPDVVDRVALARRDRRHDLRVLAAWAERARWPAAPRLGSLRTPVLIGVGADDELRRERAPRLAQLMHDAHLVTVPGDRRGALSAPELHEAAAAFLDPDS